jgi:CRP-like cAMP-binding protein
MDPSELREQAASAFAKGRFEEAAELYETYCAQAPEDFQAWIRLGDAWSRLRKKNKAVPAYYQAAKLYADNGFFPRAIAACKLVLEREPEHSGVKSMLEKLYVSRADFAPGKTLPPVDDMPIVLGQEELSKGDEEDFEALELVFPEPKAPALPKAKETPGAPAKAGAERFRTSRAGAFYAIEDAAKAGLKERGENPNIWLSVAKHTAPPAGLPVDIPLFSDLPQPALMALFRQCPLRRLAPETLVITQGERGDSFFVICSGEVRVFRVQDEEQVELAILKEGEFFGEMALLSGEPRSAFVEAVEPDTQVLEISASTLTELSKKFPQVSSALWRFYRQRLLSNVMAGSALFRPFALGDRQQLIRRFQAVDVAPLTEVVVQKQKSEGLFVVLTGHLEVVKDGKKIAVLKEGELFGEISLLTKAPATASVVAVERSSLLKLPASDFNMLISTHPQVLELLSQLMEERTNTDEAFSLESLGWDNEELEMLI